MTVLYILYIFPLCSKHIETLNIAIPSSPRTFIPTKLTDIISFHMAKYVHEPLFYHSSEDYFSSRILEKWSTNKTRTRYCFSLKKGILFHNEQEIKAEDVVHSLEECRKVKSCALSYISTIQKIGKKNDYDFYITLKAPNGLLLYSLSDKKVSIVPKKISPSHPFPIGAGPYKFTSIKNGDEYILSKFKAYHMTKKERVNTIRFKVIKNFEDFQNEHNKNPFHDINEMLPVFNPTDLEQFFIKNNFKKVEFPWINTNLIILNNSKKVFNNNVRKFLFHFFRQDRFQNILSLGPIVKKATGFIGLGLKGHISKNFIPEENIQDLYKGLNLKKPLTLKLLTFIPKTKAEKVQSQINQALPKNSLLKIKVDSILKDEFYTHLIDRSFDLLFFIWYADYAHPFFYVKSFSTNNAYNFGNINDPYLNKQIEFSAQHQGNNLIKLSSDLDYYAVKKHYLIPLSYNRGIYYFPSKTYAYELNVLGTSSFDLSHMETIE